MAISGGMTSAYLCRLVNGELRAENTTRPKELCIAPGAAAWIVLNGGHSIIAGADMVELKKEIDRLKSLAESSEVS